jgi:hypothetical protein
MRLPTAFTLIAMLATIALLPAVADAGDSGLLGPRDRAPAGYHSVKGPAGLRLLAPPKAISHDGAGRLHLYGGAEFTRTSRGRGVTSVAVSVRSATVGGAALAGTFLGRDRGWRLAWLDPLSGDGATAAAAPEYVLRYVVERATRSDLVVRYRVRVTGAASPKVG